MSEMIERVARALYPHMMKDLPHGEECIHCKEELAAREIILDRARAAIAAMREPTRAMVESASYSAEAENARLTWRDMIDEALKE